MQICPQNRRGSKHNERGFSLLELMMVMTVALILAGASLVGYRTAIRYMRIAGDMRDINGLTAQAKMRAAQDFTHARVRANLGNNTFQMEIWDKAANCWKPENYGNLAGTPCTVADAVLHTPLSTGVTFGSGGTGPANPNPQAAIAQAPACTAGVAGGPAGALYPNSACIEFNSRGRPVAPNGAPTANDALYITDNTNVYGVTVIISGLIQVWTAPANTAAWVAR